MFLTYKKRIAANLLAVIFFITFDRIFKYLALEYLVSFDILPNFFKFNLAKNYDIAFSLPLSGRYLNFVIFLVILLATYYLIRALKRQAVTESLLLAVVVFGAASNFFDRLKYGYVIDYLDLRYFTVFNLADIMIVLGAIGCGWLILDKKP